MKRLLVPIVLLLSGGLLSGTAPAQTGKFLGKSAGEWQKQLSSKDARERTNAAFALGKIGSAAEESLPALIQLLWEDKNASARDTAALAIGRIATRGKVGALAIDALCDALARDPDQTVKRSAAIALGQCACDTPRIRNALEQALDGETRIKQNAAWALGEVCAKADQPPVESLRKALADADKLVKRDAANAIGKLHAKEDARAAVGDLAACVTHDYLELRKAACFALVELVTSEDKDAATILAKVCKDETEDIEVRRNACLALSNIGGAKAKAAVPLLHDMLRGGDLDLKKRAALGLRNMGKAGQVAQDDLIEALKHNDADLRHNAAVALGGLESTKSVAALVERIADDKEKERVRVAACVALQCIGACDEAKAGAGRLIEVLDNPKQPTLVRERILWSLRVHHVGLLDYPKLFTAMRNILVEPGLKTAMSSTDQHSGKMLRYDCAFLLSVIKGVEAPEEVLPVLQEFVYDDKILIFTRIDVKSSRLPGEARKPDKGKAVELGTEDGRIMAIKALGQLDYHRVKNYPKIVAQLRVMTDRARFEPEKRRSTIRQSAGNLLSEWGVQ